MAIVKRSPLFQSVLLASVISLVACGGGGGKKRDTTPDGFTYTASTNAATSAAVTSPTVTISGINTSTPVSISGGEYSINGGAFTSAAGTITNGQTLAVRITASDKTNTPKEATITVGGVSAKFTVTTAADVTPDAFTFAAKNEVAVNTEYTSEAITVKGIDIAVPVSITGGTYSINGGAYTAAAGTVSADQTITVKITSGSATETTQTAVLTVGGVNGTFAVTTVADTTPPVAEFKFPTPYTMSEANEVKVRGTAMDDHAITSVKLVIRSFNIATPDVTIETKEVIAAPKSEANGVKDFSSWTATIPLTATAENEIKVIAIDDRENEIAIEQANKVVIRQADLNSAFPDDTNQFLRSSDTNLLIDNYDGRNRLLIVNGKEIFSVDLISGQRNKLLNENCNLLGWDLDPVTMRIFGMCDGFPLKEYDLNDFQILATHQLGSNVENFATVSGLVLDRVNNRAQVAILESPGEIVGNNGRIHAFSIVHQTLSVVVQPDSPSLMHRVGDIIVDGDRYLIADGNTENNIGSQIIGVNVLTGSQTIVSDNSIGSGDAYGITGSQTYFSSLVKDEDNNKLFISEEPSNKIFTLDLVSSKRSLLSDIGYMNEVSYLYIRLSDLQLDKQARRLYAFDNGRRAMLIIDAETGEKVILSKSLNEF